MNTNPNPSSHPTPVLPPWWSTSLTLWGVAVGVFAAASYFWLDREVTFAIKAHLPAWAGRQASALTELGYAAWSLIPLAIIFVFCLIKRKAGTARWSLLAFLGVAGSGLLVDIIKILVGRARPTELFGNHVYGFFGPRLGSHFYSFPSGHAATAGALCAALCFLAPRWRAAWIALGIVIASTRMLTGSHYPSDVAVGFYIGVAATWCARALVARLPRLPVRPPSPSGRGLG